MSAVQLQLLTTPFTSLVDAEANGPSLLAAALQSGTGVSPIWYDDANTNNQLEQGEILYSDSTLSTIYVPSSPSELLHYYYVEDTGGFGPYGYAVEVATDQSTNPTGEVLSLTLVTLPTTTVATVATTVATSATTAATQATTLATQAPSIVWDDTSISTWDADGSITGGVSTFDNRFITIVNDSPTPSQFVAGSHIGFNWISGGNGWISVELITPSNSNPQIKIEVDPNTGAATRTATLVALHPDASGVQSSTITVSQAGGDQAPVIQNPITDILENDGSGTAFVEIDFANQAGYNGGIISDDNDSFSAGTLNIVVTSLPQNGDVLDANDGSGQPIQANTTLTYDVSSSETPTLTYRPNPNFALGTDDVIGFKIVDSVGNETSSTVTITVSAPGNTAPTVSQYTASLQGITGNTKTFSLINQTNVSDDYTAVNDLDFYWVDNSAGNNPVPLSTVPILGKGTLTQAEFDPKTFTYTYTNASLPQGGPNDFDGPIYYKVVDEDGLEVVGQINITITAEANAEPVFSPDFINQQDINQYDTWSYDVSGIASDADGDTLEYGWDGTFIQGDGLVNINSSTGQLTYNSGNTFIDPGTYDEDNQYVVQFEITVRDNNPDNAVDDTLTVTLGIQPVPYIELQYTTFSISSSAACASTFSDGQFVYINTADAVNVETIQVGQSIYTTTNLSTPVVGSSAFSWIAVRQSTNLGVAKALSIDENGIIQSIINCTVSADNAWPLNIKFSDNTNYICRDTQNVQTGTLYQNIGDGKTLTEVVAAGGGLFSNQIISSANAGNPLSTVSSSDLASDGFFVDNSVANGTYYKWETYTDANGNSRKRWAIDPDSGTTLWTCPPVINYQTYSADIKFLSEDRESISNACLADSSDYAEAKIWFRGDGDLSPGIDTYTEQQKLEYILQNDIIAYTEEAAATALDYDKMWPSTVFLSDDDDDRFAVWENDNSSGYFSDYRWYGVNSNGELTIGSSGTLGTCTSQYPQPTFAVDSYCLPVDSAQVPCTYVPANTSRTNVFYAFLDCRAKTENRAPYYNLYVIDGMHTSDTNSTSFIKEFVDNFVNIPFGNPTVSVQIKSDAVNHCVKLIHKVRATNIYDAIDQLEALTYDSDGDPLTPEIPQYDGNFIRITQYNAYDLGLRNEATVSRFNDCISCTLTETVIDTYTFTGVVDEDVINRSIPNFSTETNYKLDDVSKPLLRTNPQLSGNAKLVVSSRDELYLESIEATKELASAEYKKHPLNKNGKWSYDLYKFFKNTRTPAEQIYKVKETFSNFTVQDSYDKQIEEAYHYGTNYNYSKLYTEDFRMMAPIWLDKNIPNKFVIFRVTDPAVPVDFESTSNFDNMRKIINNSEIIKTFDLSRKSNLGTYIRNHVQSESFPKTPISFNFNENAKSTFNGIDLKRGGFTKKAEFLYEDFVKQDQTLHASNDLITSGFRRNNLACANLINLEFLFNDDAAGDYSVNRYFGLYVDDIDSGYGSIESCVNGLVKFSNLNSFINDDKSSAIPPFKMMRDMPTLGYVNVSDKLYRISSKSKYNTDDFEVKVEDSANLIPSEIKIAQTGRSVNVTKNDNVGFDFLKVNVIDIPEPNDRFSLVLAKEQAYRFNFARFNEGDVWWFRMEYQGQTIEQKVEFTTIEDLVLTLNDQFLVDNGDYDGRSINSITNGNVRFEKGTDGKSFFMIENLGTLQPMNPRFEIYDTASSSLIRVEELQVPYDINANTFFAATDLAASTSNSTAFSRQGTKSNVAKAIVDSINSVDNGFKATMNIGEEHFYIRSEVPGYRLLQYGVAIPHDNSANWIQILDNEDSNNLLRLQTETVQYFVQNYVDINTDTTSLLKASSIYYFNGGNSAKKSMLVDLDSVSDINIGDSIETLVSGKYNKVVDIVDYIEVLPLKYKKVILEDNNELESGEIKVYADNLGRLGLLSAYDIHDMNFDFYDKSNSNLKELNLETPENIAYEPEREDSSLIYPFGEEDTTNYKDAPSSYFTGLSDVLAEEMSDTDNEYKVENEFDRLEENNLKEYAVTSRVVPYINKWVLKDTLTVREQPYYLNANESFGRTNFSPDLSVGDRDRLGMTHEWFYLNNLPKYLRTNSSVENPSYLLNDSFSYVNFMQGSEITPSLFKSATYDYFDKFMVTEGFEIVGEGGYKTFVKTNTQKKYTRIGGGNDVSFANTIFKGLKVSFKKRKEFTSQTPSEFIKSSEFNGYKFSTLVNVKTAEDSNSIDFEVIQNKKFKYVVFLISLRLDDLWADNSLNRKLLYELNHSLVWNNESGTFEYSDIKLDGAFDFTDSNLSNQNADDYLVLKGIPHSDSSLPNFIEQINKNNDDVYGNIYVRLQTAFGEQLIQLTIASVLSEDEIKLAELPMDITNGTPVPLDTSNMPQYLEVGAEYTYVQGGVNAYKGILDSLSASSIANMLKFNPSMIKYTTVETDGSLLENRFIILLEDGIEFIKESYIVTVEDDDKPKSFKLQSGVIGYGLAQGLTYYPFLIRHNGDYTVDTTPVVTFTDIYAHMKTNTLQITSNNEETLLEEKMYKHSLSDLSEIELARDYYNRYNRCGVAFNLGFIYDNGSHDSSWGYIRNHFYRKVNEFNASGVTKLSTSTDKLPLYPLIGEVAIDKKDVHVFKSSWDKNYYTRSLSGGGSELVPGTFETKEEKSYLASTIMKVKDNYVMLDFDVEKTSSEEELDEILANDTSSSDIVMFEDEDRIMLDFYVTNTVEELLSKDGVFFSIRNYVLPENSAEDKSTVKDDAQLYVKDNLMNLFNVSQIKLYTYRVKGEPSSIESSQDISNLDDNGYISDQNFEFKSHEQKPLNFRLIYNKRLGYSYRIRPMVKIMS